MKTTEDHAAHQGSSDRAFGLVFAAVFAVIGLWPLAGGGAARLWALAAGAGFLGFALVWPLALSGLNRVWYRFGLLLHRIVSPVAIGIIFFAAITPMALLMRAMGKTPLRLAFDRTAKSYWIRRDPPGPDPQTMNDQF